MHYTTINYIKVWHEAPGELLRSLLEHLYELVAESSEKRTNLRLMRDLQLVHKLLHILSDVKLNSTRQILLALLSILLSQPRQADLLWYAVFLFIYIIYVIHISKINSL